VAPVLESKATDWTGIHNQEQLESLLPQIPELVVVVVAILQMGALMILRVREDLVL
jgi:hypothetical protein